MIRLPTVFRKKSVISQELTPEAALALAISQDDVAAMDKAIARGANLDVLADGTLDRSGYFPKEIVTLPMLAIMSRAPHALKRLLDAGQSPDRIPTADEARMQFYKPIHLHETLLIDPKALYQGTALSYAEQTFKTMAAESVIAEDDGAQTKPKTLRLSWGNKRNAAAVSPLPFSRRDFDNIAACVAVLIEAGAQPSANTFAHLAPPASDEAKAKFNEIADTIIAPALAKASSGTFLIAGRPDNHGRLSCLQQSPLLFGNK